MALAIAPPLSALRQQIERVAQDPTLVAHERASELRRLRDDLEVALGAVDSYLGRAEKFMEAEPDPVVQLRQNAEIYEEALRRGLATPEQLQENGYLPPEEIDRLDEEGLLEATAHEFVGKLHPRDRHGKFIDSPDVIQRVKSPVDGSVETIHDCGGDVEKAATLLSEGKRVKLDQPRQVSTLIHDIAKDILQARAAGGPVPDYDLCKITVAGTNLFCVKSKGIPRVKMPQLSGIPSPGSRASRLPKDSRGGVDLDGEFRRMLEARGVQITNEQESASSLRATQNQLNGGKVSGIEQAILGTSKFTYAEKRLFVSRDNYIVDGHHRWAAEVVADLEDGHLGDVQMPVARVDMGIVQLLDEANRFAADWGIPQASFSSFASQRAIAEAGFDPRLHPRDRHGHWIDTPDIPDRAALIDHAARDLVLAAQQHHHRVTIQTSGAKVTGYVRNVGPAMATIEDSDGSGHSIHWEKMLTVSDDDLGRSIGSAVSAGPAKSKGAFDPTLPGAEIDPLSFYSKPGWSKWSTVTDDGDRSKWTTPPGVKYSPEVMSITSPKGAEDYFKTRGINADLVPPDTDQGRNLAADTDFFRQIAQAVTDAQDKFPLLRTGKYPLRDIKLGSRMRYGMPTSFAADLDGLWGLTSADIDTSRNPGSTMTTHHGKQTSTGIIINDVDQYGLQTRNAEVADGRTARSNRTPYGRMTHELGHATYSAAGNDPEWDVTALEDHISPDEISEYISGYAASNVKEAWAELFGMRNTPRSGYDQLPERVRASIDGVANEAADLYAEKEGKPGRLL